MKSMNLSFLALAPFFWSLAMAAGCTKSPERSPKSDVAQIAAAGAAVASAPRAVDPRDQYQLARQIRAAERMDRYSGAQRLREIRRDWQGRRYRWHVHVIPQLCTNAQQCNVLPFDRSTPDRKPVQGWMPRLHLSEAAFHAIHKECRSGQRCGVLFEGTLSRLVLSSERFTSLAFDQVEIIDVQ